MAGRVTHEPADPLRSAELHHQLATALLESVDYPSSTTIHLFFGQVATQIIAATTVRRADGTHEARRTPDAVIDVMEYGIEFRLTGQRRDDRLGAVLEGTSLTHSVQILEGLGLTKIDAGVYEADLPGTLLDAARTEQVQLPGWPGTYS